MKFCKRECGIGAVIFYTVVLGFLAFTLIPTTMLLPTFWKSETPLTGSPQEYHEGTLLQLKPKHPNGIVVGTSEQQQKLRVLVWVMTMESNLETKAMAVKETWGKRCDSILFFSSKANKEFPTVGLNVAEGRNHLTAKTMAAFRYIYKYHYNDADWFMKTDDDTYVVVENLKLFLSSKDSSDPLFFGHFFHLKIRQGYYSGGGGYVISKEALRRFGTKAVNSTICKQDGADEDVDWGLCMEALGVKTDHSLDKQGRTLFHPESPTLYFLNRVPTWINDYSPHANGGFAVSPWAITFHYVKPDEMKLMDFFLYYWQVNGSPSIGPELKQTTPGTNS